MHLLVEACNKQALARGMQAFQISAAKWLNRAESKHRGRKRNGPAFPDRYHASIITMPMQARRGLVYVLNNWRKHKEDKSSATHHWLLDPYSSAVQFKGWAERNDWIVPEDHEPLPIAQPQSWLLRDGWKRHGAISVFEVPGARV